jgi:ABC-type Zn2+ transport system substrate-binding protein/surface adhesin
MDSVEPDGEVFPIISSCVGGAGVGAGADAGDDDSSSVSSWTLKPNNFKQLVEFVFIVLVLWICSSMRVFLRKKIR